MDIGITSQGGQVNLEYCQNKSVAETGINTEVKTMPADEEDGYTKDDVIRAVDKLNGLLKEENTYAEYSVHEKFGDIMIKIINRDTKQVVMECPPKKILDLVAKLCDLVGVAIDKKA